jgi:hypothetical protein
MKKQLLLAAQEATFAYYTAVHFSCSEFFSELSKEKLFLE